MSFTRSRLRRLEAAKWGGPCAECKLAPGGFGYNVLADVPGAPPLDREGRPVDPDERCAGCGRFLWYVIRVVHDGNGGGGVRWP